LAKTFGPYTPAWLWQWTNEIFLGHKREIRQHAAIRPERLAELELAEVGRGRDFDFTYRPRKDGFAMRLRNMQAIDNGNINKGTLAGWGVDRRSPLADQRLVEFCLSIPTENYLAGGVPRALGRRALADRLPPAVLDEQKKGYQAVDWHEGVTAARADVAAELDRMAACASAVKVLDIARMKCLLKSWPTSGWEREDVVKGYRLALLRGISVGHFLRKASGGNQ